MPGLRGLVHGYITPDARREKLLEHPRLFKRLSSATGKRPQLDTARVWQTGNEILAGKKRRGMTCHRCQKIAFLRGVYLMVQRYLRIMWAFRAPRCLLSAVISSVSDFYTRCWACCIGRGGHFERPGECCPGRSWNLWHVPDLRGENSNVSSWFRALSPCIFPMRARISLMRAGGRVSPGPAPARLCASA